MSYYFSKTLDSDFDAAVERTTAALKEIKLPSAPNVLTTDNLHAEEAAFWLDQPIADGLPKGRQDRMHTSRMLLAPYSGRIRRSAAGEVLPGVAVRSYAGHSPSHACWTVEGGDAKVLFWGDIVHVPAVQVPYPEVCIVYDYDSIAAAASRRRLFAEIADTPTIIAGAHLDAFYRLSSGSDGYRLEPIEVCGVPFPSS
jgi:glyoxylase-like metal-dependent hydrolase (beta-lactamase superfamily II)